jgi:hypothetical protein
MTARLPTWWNIAWMPLSERGARTGRLTDGTDGNERLTGLTAVLLLGLLAVEGATILFLRPLLPVHLFVGMLLIPPVALKLASTGYRFARYYTGSVSYRRRGTPPIVLRATAPVLIASTLTVLATGVWLLLAGPSSRDSVLPIHKVSFFVWLAVAAIHILGHLTALPRVLSREYRRPDLAPGRASRQLALALALGTGVVIALLLVPHFGTWETAQRLH